MSKEQNIKILEEFDHIRLRPGMYIGVTDTPKTLVREVLDNSLDECLNGYSPSMSILTGKDDEGHWAEVTDAGRGLPQYEMEDGGEMQVAAKLLFVKLFSGGKFDKDNYQISSGLHGVGLTVCNALSHKLQVTTWNGETRYELEFSRGLVVKESKSPDESASGTRVRIYPDAEIFTTTKFDVDTRSFQVAMTQRSGLSININGKEIEELKFSDIYTEPMLLPEPLILNYTHKEDTSHPTETDRNGFEFRVMMNWAEAEFDTRTVGSLNLISVNAGLHIRTAKNMVETVLHEKFGRFDPRDYSTGLRFHVSAFVPDPQFSSQSKETLTKSLSLQYSTGDILTKFRKSLKGIDFEPLLTKIEKYKHSMKKLSQMDFVNSVVKKGSGRAPSRNLGLGIYECTAKNRDNTELFIVEGKSAAGGLVMERNKSTQAVLPLRGKTLNVASSGDLESILSNTEIKAMVNSVGVGISPEEDMERVRYDKIIIFADADPDGKNIAGLILGAFCWLTPELAKSGRLYVLKTPLYKQGGKYLYTDEDLDKKKPFKRFKGLGEMNPDELAVVSLHEETRQLIQLDVNDDNIDEILALVGTGRAKKELLTNRGII